MPVACQQIIDAMEDFSPTKFASKWDNVGLLAGSPAQEIHKVIVALDTTWETINKALTYEKAMIVSHHPVIFKPISSLRSDLPQGKILSAIVKNDLAVYAAHTNLDIAPGGVNDILAEKLGLLNTEALEETFSEKLFKIIVFVPETHIEEVRSAMSGAGAGHIGNYSGCTFDTPGTGTFFPLEGANPYIGRTGRLEYVKERRLETIVPENLKSKVVSAMLRAHPYEEVAYDEIMLQNGGKSYGFGRVGDLAQPFGAAKFIGLVKSALGVRYVSVAGDMGKIIKRVAVCGGSGAGFACRAASRGADMFITGDVKYHDAQKAADNGLIIVDAGHFATENVFVPFVAAYLERCASENNWGIEVEGLADVQNIFSVY